MNNYKDLSKNEIFYYSEIFQSINGESKQVGKNVLFLRLSRCNLHCTWCDSRFAWDNNLKEFRDNKQQVISIYDVIKRILQLHVNGINITGGEPMLQQDTIYQLLLLIQKNHNIDNNKFTVEIETNGTIMPNNDISDVSLVHFNISPKLANSGNSKKLRYNESALQIFNNLNNTIFKFVNDNKQTTIDEIKQFQAKLNIDNSKVYLMPLTSFDQSNEEILFHIHQTLTVIFENGWNFSPRLHILIWGAKKRGV